MSKDDDRSISAIIKMRLDEEIKTSNEKNNEIIKNIEKGSKKVGPDAATNKDDQDHDQRGELFDFLLKYLKMTTWGFAIFVLLSFLHFQHFYIDDFALRIIATVLPAQAVALVLFMVKYFYPDNSTSIRDTISNLLSKK